MGLVSSGKRSCVSVPQVDLTRDASDDVILTSARLQDQAMHTGIFAVSEFKSGLRDYDFTLWFSN